MAPLPPEPAALGGSIFPNVSGNMHALRAQPLNSAGIPPRFPAHLDPLPQHLRSAAGAFGSKAYNVKQPKAPLLRSICSPRSLYSEPLMVGPVGNAFEVILPLF